MKGGGFVQSTHCKRERMTPHSVLKQLIVD